MQPNNQNFNWGPTQPQFWTLFWGQPNMKSENPQHNTIGRLDDCSIVWWSNYYFDRLGIKQWTNGLASGHWKLFILFILNYKKNWKKLERILQEMHQCALGQKKFSMKENHHVELDQISHNLSLCAHPIYLNSMMQGCQIIEMQ